MIKTKTKLFNIYSANATNGSYKSSVLISLSDLSFHQEVIKKVFSQLNIARFLIHFIL